MKLETTGKAFTYRWPGGEVHLEPGKPIDLPDERAKRLLDKAAGKVRMIPPTIQPGDRIAWDRAGMTQTGTIDFIHVDDTGQLWAFTTGKDWAAINMKIVRLASAEDIEAAATDRPAASCFACGSTEHWISIHGAIVCVTCHPPVQPSLVKAWVGPDDGDGDDHADDDTVINGDAEPFDVGPA